MPLHQQRAKPGRFASRLWVELSLRHGDFVASGITFCARSLQVEKEPCAARSRQPSKSHQKWPNWGGWACVPHQLGFLQAWLGEPAELPAGWGLAGARLRVGTKSQGWAGSTHGVVGDYSSWFLVVSADETEVGIFFPSSFEHS